MGINMRWKEMEKVHKYGNEQGNEGWGNNYIENGNYN